MSALSQNCTQRCIPQFIISFRLVSNYSAACWLPTRTTSNVEHGVKINVCMIFTNHLDTCRKLIFERYPQSNSHLCIQNEPKVIAPKMSEEQDCFGFKTMAQMQDHGPQDASDNRFRLPRRCQEHSVGSQDALTRPHEAPKYLQDCFEMIVRDHLGPQNVSKTASKCLKPPNNVTHVS